MTDEELKEKLTYLNKNCEIEVNEKKAQFCADKIFPLILCSFV